MAASYRKSKGNFVFYNANPKGSLTSNDCVIRAIAKATKMNWDDIYAGLYRVGMEEKDLPNSRKVYSKFLCLMGYSMQKQPHKADNSKYTASEFADKFNKGTYIISLAGHLSVVVDGKIYDTWNCGNKCVGNYWTTND